MMLKLGLGIIKFNSIDYTTINTLSNKENNSINPNKDHKVKTAEAH